MGLSLKEMAVDLYFAALQISKSNNVSQYNALLHLEILRAAKYRSKAISFKESPIEIHRLDVNTVQLYISKILKNKTNIFYNV